MPKAKRGGKWGREATVLEWTEAGKGGDSERRRGRRKEKRREASWKEAVSTEHS